MNVLVLVCRKGSSLETMGEGQEKMSRKCGRCLLQKMRINLTSAGEAKQRQRFGLDEWPVILEDENRMLVLLKMLLCQIICKYECHSPRTATLIRSNLIQALHRSSGAKTSALNETANSAYGANQVPIEQYLSPLPGESPNTAHANLKRKAPETATYREKKREIDRAYRLRCREKKMKTEQDVVVLTEENNKLKRENEQLKREGVQQLEMVQTQKEEMKVVKNKLCPLKDQLQTQNALVKEFSSQVTLVDDRGEGRPY
ncbi:hypothetical protein NC652_009324 [Populus alba x Populus x berolinensis]|nr:hypothetical protein NC652_009324 [Populus alba x Populus x berolinensis]